MKIDRLVSMILILLDKERVGARELAERFEVSQRTVYRDMDAINRAGIPVRSLPGVGGGFEIMREYKVDKKVFSSADLSAILMGLSSLSSLVRGEELVNALAKVKSFIPADRAEDIERGANRITVDIRPWIGKRNTQPYLETIKTAVRESRLLSFAYMDRHGKQTARTAEPYQLVLKNSEWYWQGYCHTRREYRLFKVSRMANLQMRKETFTQREYPKPRLEFAEELAAMQIPVKLRIQSSLVDRVLAYCAGDQLAPDGDGHYLVSFPFIENDYHYDMLLGFGTRCECLEPPHVRAELKRRIRELAALYEK